MFIVEDLKCGMWNNNISDYSFNFNLILRVRLEYSLYQMFIYIFIMSYYLQPLEIKELPLCKFIGNVDFFPFDLT